MSQNVTDLSTEQAKAIELLQSGKTMCDIARALDINRRTLWRWRQLPAFQAAQSEAQQQRREEMHEQMTEIIRLSLLALEHELKKAEDPRFLMPIDTAIKVLRIAQPRMNLAATGNNLPI